MKLDVVPESLMERLALRAGLVPRPILQTILAAGMARALHVGVKLGVFETLNDSPMTTEDVAARVGTHPYPTGKLLNVLTSMGYLGFLQGERYSLTKDARKWLAGRSPTSLRDFILEQEFIEWPALDRLEEFLRTGTALDLHSDLGEKEWALYQRGMRNIASLSADELGRRVPVPRGAQDMLDVGGSHGYHSVVLCRRHPGLRSTILDLPEAVKYAAPLLEMEGMGDRVVHRVGDASTDDFGVETFDLVYTSNLAHHLEDEENRDLARRVARALRPRGHYVIVDSIRPRSAKEGGQIGTLGDLFFALTSRAGTWSFEEMADWQRSAGLQPRKPIRLRTGPGVGIQSAVKEARS
jgi:SAM-dependent methyltransferase